MAEQTVKTSTVEIKTLCEQVDDQMKRPTPVVYEFSNGRRVFRDRVDPYNGGA